MYKGLSTQVEIGKQYAGLIPIEISGRNSNGDPTFYNCRCVRCGKMIQDVHFMDIAWYRVRCCRNCDPNDLTGMRFTKLVALEKTFLVEKNGSRPNRKKTAWRCRCDCGGEKVVRMDSLLLGLTRSCGCIKNYDLIGKRFGHLTVTREIGVSSDHTKRYFYCKCDCGANVVVIKNNLTSGHTRSCGRCSKTLDLNGKRFGRLTVLKIHPYLKCNTNRMWICKCDCGKVVNVPGHSLVSGHTKSCGCLNELNRKYKTDDERRLASIYCGMKQRCYNPCHQSYKDYGGRGICICDEWLLDSSKFINWSINNGYKKGLSIDRIDVNGPYSPENCRWVDSVTQNNNRRTSIKLDVDGDTRTLSEWSRYLNVIPWRIYYLYMKNGDEFIRMLVRKHRERHPMQS